MPQQKQSPHGPVKLQASKGTFRSLLIVCYEYRERPAPVTNLARYQWFLEHPVLISAEKKISRALLSEKDTDAAIKFSRAEAECLLQVVSSYLEDSENYDDIFLDVHHRLQQTSLV